MTAAQLIQALGGAHGKAQCPSHDDRNPSLSISDRPGGGVLVRCHAGCDQAAVWAALKAKGFVGGDDHGRTSRRREVSMARPSDRSAEVLEIWNASIPAAGTPAAEYLACRGITIPPPDCIRYHSANNLLIAAVQQLNGDITAVQRIYLTTDPRGTWKQKRLSLGPIKGGAVRLTPPAASLQITESVEDGLALLQMTGRPTWAVPGAGFIKNLEPPAEVREVVLAPDADEAGLAAIAKAASKLAKLGLTIGTMLPPVDGADWCDMLELWDERAAIVEDGEGISPDDAELEAWRGLPR